MAFPFHSGAFSPDRDPSLAKVLWSKLWGGRRRRRRAVEDTKARAAAASRALGFRMDPLEPRLLLSADLMPFTADLSAHPGSDYLLKYENLTQSVQLIDRMSRQVLDQRLAQQIEYVRVIGSDGDDSLTVDFAEGFLRPLDLRFEGGLGDDTLSFVGGAFETVNVAATGAGSGAVVAGDGAGAAHQISFSGVSLLRDTSGAAHRIFADETGEGQVLRLRDAGAASDGLSAIDGGGALLAYEFVAPSIAVTLDAGAGDDSIVYEGVDDAILGKVVVQGGAGSDAVIGPPQDATWHVTGLDAGDVAGVSFVSVENLLGPPTTRTRSSFMAPARSPGSWTAAPAASIRWCWRVEPSSASRMSRPARIRGPSCGTAWPCATTGSSRSRTTMRSPTASSPRAIPRTPRYSPSPAGC